MTDWSNNLCTSFMELFQMEPIIWNPKNPYHKDKSKVNDAWDRISKELNIPIQELKTKKISLMATFRGHLRRKKASIKSGAGINDIYKPIWFLYELMESFLCDINECLPTINTETQGTNSQAIEIEEESSMNEGSPMPQSPMPQSPMPQSPIASTSQQSFPPNHPRRRAKSSEHLINEASKQIKDTFNTLNSVLKDRRNEEDECDLYCKLLAKKLRYLPENERAIFMYEIDGMFISRLRNITSPSPNFSDSHYIPQRHYTSSQSSYSEPLHNEMRILKRPNSSCTSYSDSEPAIPNKIVPNQNMSPQVTYPPVLQYIPAPDRSPIGSLQSMSQQPFSSQSSYSDLSRHTPRQQNTARMPLPKPIVISRKNTFTPVLHIPDPNLNPVENSQSVTILSDQVIVSPARDYLENYEE